MSGVIETGFGRVLAVVQSDLGSTLDGDHLAGATVLTVEDAADFDDINGGQVVIEGTTYAYVVNEDPEDVDDAGDGPSTITVDPALVADADDGAKVLLYDPLTGATETEWLAQVTVEGDDPGDSLDASIRSSLVDQLADGLRGITGEAVELQWDEDETLWVVDILGRPVDARAGVVKFRNTDTFVAAGPGDMACALTYEPIDGSEHVAWNGLLQPAAEWARSGKVLTLTDPGLEAADQIDVSYAYDLTGNGATPAPPPTPGGSTYAEVVAADGPVWWAKLDEASGTTASDSSGDAHHGTYGGTVLLGQPTLAPGLPGTSVDFAGTGWAEFGPGAAWSRPPSFSAEIWVKPRSIAGYLLCCDNAGISLGPSRIWNMSGDGYARVISGATETNVIGGALTAVATYHIVMTFDSATKVLTLYRDGVGLGDNTAPGAMNTDTTWPLRIAADAGGFYLLDGFAQHAALYDHVLTPDRIAAHYSAGITA